MEMDCIQVKQKLRFPGQTYENLTPELLTKSMWVSSVLAMIFALPPLVTFIGLHQSGINIGITAGIGFGLHFATLAYARKIASALSALLD